MRYLFEDYALDTDRRELHRATDMIVVTPQVFDLLDYLIRNRERVVSKDDLINAVWNGRIVSEAALTTRLNAARSAVGDTGEKQRLIKTLPRKGFRFVGTVQEAQRLAVEPASSAAHSGGMKPPPNSAPRLSIVVLPFANLSGDPEQDYFVDGVTESVTMDLSRISGSFVIGRHTAFTYKDKAADLKQVGRELNVRYVLEGSVQRRDGRLRVNVQLIDAETGAHLWADRFDKPDADLFGMQDEIVSQLANTLKGKLIAVEARLAERSMHPDATDLTFQGKACLYKATTAKQLIQARGFFERASAINPRSVGALLGMAASNFRLASSLLADDRIACFSVAETQVIEALSIAPDHSSAHMILGGVYIYTNRAVQGIAECEQALRLDRNEAFAHSSIGLAKYYLGRPAEAERHILDALRLSPRDSGAAAWMTVAGVAKIQLGVNAEAVGWLRRSIEANRNFAFGHFGLAAALGLLGALDEARAAVKTGLALDPDFTIQRVLATRLSDNPTYLAGRERICEGLRLAGVPEG
ncbi:winged helix-turn-helix domain-containing tetratricopeptide repeat protein [Bradyrhizobium japonicum]|uniref:winged helix-turn-helix domain-containing tetratricopeptide repeat protein n=1 Tax=Bradyrhizobium japonicum TaxID=375 RepID=UPI0020A1B6B5|nr:winged helix-turn-helix domain-containing protein [Bradyrhizobium japonicum]MCP1781032.1 TolB-like protein/Flp pilus assembly protein TadD [Bradyrhizobium japonicum]MCP1955977.1 TolB-like protein/Flp pilus assembly protein TadD [Bradyrhizobium japonicum]